MFTYSTKGTCSRQILLRTSTPKTNFIMCALSGGCGGNLQGIARLVEGKKIDEIENLLAGIRCRNGTSCPDQLSKAIAEYKAERAAAATAAAAEK